MKYDGIRTKPVGNEIAARRFAESMERSGATAEAAPVGIRGAGSSEAGEQMPDSGAATGSPVGGGKLLARGIDTFVQELGAATPDQLRTLGITPELAKRILDAVS